jgi:hypothetical protein
MRPSPHARALHAIFREVMNTLDGATYFAGRVWGVFTHYDLGGDGVHPLVGYSVPNFEFENGATVGEMMRDGLGMLLDFDGEAALKGVAEEFGGGMKYVAARAKERLGMSALAVRPDGIVAWACEGKAEGGAAREAVGRWFSRSRQA